MKHNHQALTLLLPLLLLLANTITATKSTECPNPLKNIIYIVPDGFGPASQTLARDYLSMLGQDPENPVIRAFGVDEFAIGNVRTSSEDNLITDSAAAATAFACGVKTQNGVIALDENGLPVGSILEAAKLAGLKTGLVVTSRITHATPACYSSHVPNRDSEATIATQQIGHSHPLGSMVDLLFGGGRCFFQPKGVEGSCRDDEIDLLDWAGESGFRVVTDREGFDELVDTSGNGNASLPLLGLFNQDHMEYELDRDPAVEPSLYEMVEVALKSLSDAAASSDKGYFLMIEASRIDHGGHANDAPAHLHDTIMYNKVMDQVRNWIDESAVPEDTLLLSAADHETGGLSLIEEFNPTALRKATNTTATLDTEFKNYHGDDAAMFLRENILPAYGVFDPTSDEIEELIEYKGKSEFANILGGILASRVGINWSSDGHSAVDVTLFGYGAEESSTSGCRRGQEIRANMAGNHDNKDLPGYLADMLGLDLGVATAELRKDGVDWVPKEQMMKREHIHYH